MYPGPNVSCHGKSLYKPYITWVIYGIFHPQESQENTINTMGTLLGVHPIVPWGYASNSDNPYGTPSTSWLLKHQLNQTYALVKLDHFPKDRGEHEKNVTSS